MQRNINILVMGGDNYGSGMTATECVNTCLSVTICVGASFKYRRSGDETECYLFFTEPSQDDDIRQVRGVDYYAVIKRCPATGKLQYLSPSHSRMSYSLLTLN